MNFYTTSTGTATVTITGNNTWWLDDGSAGVREPRNPYPPIDSTSESLTLPRSE